MQKDTEQASDYDKSFGRQGGTEEQNPAVGGRTGGSPDAAERDEQKRKDAERAADKQRRGERGR
jgi:hypothetical protein